jgi:hypothetical protein
MSPYSGRITKDVADEPDDGEDGPRAPYVPGPVPSIVNLIMREQEVVGVEIELPAEQIRALERLDSAELHVRIVPAREG